MPTITAFGQTFKTKKHLVFYARGLQDRAQKIRLAIDNWDGESDLVIDDTSVVIDDMELADLSAETIEQTWEARQQAIEAEQAAQVESLNEQMRARLAAETAAREALKAEIRAEVLEELRGAQAGVGGR